MVEGMILGFIGFIIATVIALIMLGFYLLTLTRAPKGMRHTRKDEDVKKDDHAAEDHDKDHPADDDSHHTKKGGFFSRLLRRIAFWGVIALVACVGVVLVYFLTPIHEWISFGGPTTQSSVSAFGTKECPGQKLDFALDREHWYIEVNPSNLCRVLIYESVGHVLQDPTLVFLVTDKETPAAGSYTLCPKSAGNGKLNWDCSPRE